MLSKYFNREFHMEVICTPIQLASKPYEIYILLYHKLSNIDVRRQFYN